MGVVTSESESRRFGLQIGRAYGQEGVTRAIDSVAVGLHDLVFVRVPVGEADKWPDPSRTGRAADQPGDSIEILDCGQLVTFEGRVAGQSGHELVPITKWTEDESRLVIDMFSGYRNHVAENPYLDASVVPAGYAEWAGSHLQAAGPAACYRLVNPTGETEGFAAVTFELDLMTISLAGVVPASRGRGVYRRLLGELEAEASALGLNFLRIATQVGHATPIHAWMERGWREVQREGIIHVVGPKARRRGIPSTNGVA